MVGSLPATRPSPPEADGAAGGCGCGRARTGCPGRAVTAAHAHCSQTMRFEYSCFQERQQATTMLQQLAGHAGPGQVDSEALLAAPRRL